MQRFVKQKNRHRAAFTLIEVLIVVVIVAVLAAVVVSQFDGSTESAKDSTLTHNMHILQSMIELYRVNHNGGCPMIRDKGLPQLTSATNGSGEVGPTGPDYPFGPYIVAMPANPFDQSKDVGPVATPGVPPTAVSGSGVGWQYDETTGSIWPNNPEFFR